MFSFLNIIGRVMLICFKASLILMLCVNLHYIFSHREKAPPDIFKFGLCGPPSNMPQEC